MYIYTYLPINIQIYTLYILYNFIYIYICTSYDAMQTPCGVDYNDGFN